MSRWGEFEAYPRAPKKPAPERGIRMRRAGTTWWGQRWIEALENVLSGDAARLARGRTYARAGRTHDLVVESGKVSAKVTGSRATPYQITLRLRPLDASAWRRAIAAMAEKAQFSAELLAGQMPRQIDEAFEAAGASLFPEQRADLETSCSCPDWGDPCKHVAATHYVLGEALDRDPFLLFELRGKNKHDVLEALRTARGASGEPTARSGRRRSKQASAGGAPEVPALSLGKLNAADYDRPRQPLPSLQFWFDEPLTHGAVLQQLGAPSVWHGDANPLDVLAPLVRAAAESARSIALTDPPAPEDASAPAPQKPRAPARSRAAGKRALRRRD